MGAASGFRLTANLALVALLFTAMGALFSSTASAGDSFASPFEINEPDNTNATIGLGFLNSTIEAGEPFDVGPYQGVFSGSEWFSWTAPITSTVTVSVNVAAGVGVYTGSSLGSLVTIDEQYSAVTFNATQGVNYRIALGKPVSEPTMFAFVLNVKAVVPDTQAPVITITSGPSGTSSATSASFTFTADEAGVLFTCQLDGGGFSACQSPASLNSLSAGNHTFEVKGTDAAGNSSVLAASRAWTVDLGSPVTASGTVAPGESISTDPTQAGPTVTRPVTVSISVPGGGQVAVVEQPANTVPPTGFAFMGQQFSITAPDATVEQPLLLTFRLDQSILPPGVDIEDLTMLRDGVPAANCSGPAGTATPDPCILIRGTAGDGDVVLGVLSSHASDWNAVVVDVDPPVIDVGDGKAKITIAKIKGPGKTRTGKKVTYKVKIKNSGNAVAKGVKLRVSGKGVKAKKSVGKIPAGKSKTVKVKLKFKKPGKIKTNFKVTSANAGGKTVKKKIKVRK